MAPHDRFKNLERSREDVPQEKPRVQGAGRFGAVETGPAAPSVVSVPQGQLDRFREPAPPLADAVSPEEDRPYTRCALCKVDSSGFARGCAQCGASFDTALQRAFDEEFWAAQHVANQQQKASEEAFVRQQREAQSSSGQLDRKGQEAFVRGLLDHEQARFEGQVGGPTDGEAPLGPQLLGAISDGRVRLAVGIALVLLPVTLLALPSIRMKGLGLLLAAIGIALFAPRWMTRGRRGRWFDD